MSLDDLEITLSDDDLIIDEADDERWMERLIEELGENPSDVLAHPIPERLPFAFGFLASAAE